MGKRNLAKERQWRELIDGHASSGLSIRAYCSVKQVKEAQFYSWRRELRLRDSAEDDRRKPGAADFLPVSVDLSFRSIELVHPSGVVVRVPPVFDSSALSRVLELLDRRIS